MSYYSVFELNLNNQPIIMIFYYIFGLSYTFYLFDIVFNLKY